MCGVAGIYYFDKSRKDAAEDVMLSLFAEQHRGQESCGIAISDGHEVYKRKFMGHVKEVFTPQVLEELKGFSGIGHVRYPTRGSSVLTNAQPYVVETLGGPVYSVASNGDIVNYEEVTMKLRAQGVHFKSNNDGELLGRYIVYHHERMGLSITAAIRKLMKEIKGAFSTVFLTRDTLYVFRDPYGIRPLHIGEIEGGIAVASETCALDILRAENIRAVKPGEIIAIDSNGLHSTIQDEIRFEDLKQNTYHCIFELIYFSRPDSAEFGEYVYDVRQKIGATLASYDEFKADVVIPVPDSSNFMAIGYAQAKNIPFNFGLVRNHYVGRTFIKPNQYLRDESVRQKFNPLKDFFKDKKVVVVDDSIVRGTTLRKIVRMIRQSGAAEVHLRIGSPPVKHSCYYGIDTPTREELIANNMTLNEIRDYVGADSLKYLKIDDLKKCVATDNSYCYACFSGEYPIKKDIGVEKTEENISEKI
ncbi:MAG: amidophosphoribosyltransferase [Calditrichia bacterium]